MRIAPIALIVLQAGAVIATSGQLRAQQPPPAARASEIARGFLAGDPPLDRLLLHYEEGIEYFGGSLKLTIEGDGTVQVVERMRGEATESTARLSERSLRTLLERVVDADHGRGTAAAPEVRDRSVLRLSVGDRDGVARGESTWIETEALENGEVASLIEMLRALAREAKKSGPAG